eukprot:11301918-Karenia_brevis.AAC.1
MRHFTRFQSATSAREKDGRWRCVALLVSEMRRVGLPLGVICFATALTALGEDGQWHRLTTSHD